MTLPSDAMAEAPLAARAVPPAPLSATRPFFWSVRRELWENRSIYIGPLAAAGAVLFGFLISTANLPRIMHDFSKLDVARESALVALPYSIAAFVIVVTALIVGFFYCLGALHNERRDRTILFWKSLPVSDLTTVLSKASIPLVVLPLVTFVVIVAMQLIMLLLSTAFLLLNGLNAALPWTQLPLFEMSAVLLYGLAVLALWYAPIWAWLLLVSGWARRTPFLWAVLPPLALCVVEKIAFGTSNLGDLLKYRLSGGIAEAFGAPARGSTMVGLVQLDPARFLSTPGLWAGLAFAAAFLAAAVWQRRYREPL
jgi:ABC-2 type transport system permease protein